MKMSQHPFNQAITARDRLGHHWRGRWKLTPCYVDRLSSRAQGSHPLGYLHADTIVAPAVLHVQLISSA
jgi:hypothetical protein